MALPLVEIGERIRKIRTELAIPTNAIASALGTSEKVVTEIEEGRLLDLPGDYILIISHILKTDFRYFISHELDAVEQETQQIYRHLSKPSPDDFFSIRKFISYGLNEAELEELLSIPKKNLPPYYPDKGNLPYRHKDQGKAVAAQERMRLLLGFLPIPNIFEKIRSQGIHLFRQKLKDSELSGATIFHPKAGICILINYHDDIFRQFFSAAHEYCHVLFDRKKVEAEGCVVSYSNYKKRYSKYDEAYLTELRADNFAGEFLLPSEATNKYQKPQDIHEVKELIGQIARDYKINAGGVAIWMKQNGWISERTLQSFQKKRPVVIRKNEKTDPDIPIEFTSLQKERRKSIIEHEISTYYLELLRKALTEEVITFGRFAEMMDLTQEDAYHFVKDINLAL